ncbi:MAG: hypothetical protein A2314_01410 [Elusimicrobia bacterium RIFOXYB2_FULL_50_12]|nr:MAG: hypothetical protein A2314_01410 [Elusimicrobia bacterium RIFOXYB2_FULL_50_12]
MKKLFAVASLIIFLALTVAVSYHRHGDMESHDDCVICLLSPAFNFIFSCPRNNLEIRLIFLFVIAVYGFINSIPAIFPFSSRSPPKAA